MIIDPKITPVSRLQTLLQHAIAPRPIALVSTMARNGQVNLSPFSFFNLFSANPPVVVFSPARRVRDNTVKHTLENLYEVRECAINIVTYPMLRQTILASHDHEKNINEFEVAGFTPAKSKLVSPPGVKESPVRLECRASHIYPLGKEAGAGNLVIAEILLVHYDDELLNTDGLPDQQQMDLVGRLGGDWYCRLKTETLFEMKLSQAPEEDQTYSGNHAKTEAG